MKKIYFLSLVFAIFSSMSLIGQNLVANGDLEAWDNSTTPTNWNHAESITQETAIVHSGTYSAKQQSADGTQDFGHEYITGIVAGGSYQLSYYYYDNDVNARTRIWSKWLDDTGAPVGTTIESDFSVDSPDWQFYNESFIAPVGATQFYLEVRVYKEAASGGYVYYDDFSFTLDQTIYPEPTNYPADFIATAAGLNINVQWTDATGAQLPTGYLLLGEKVITKAFDIPVDGVPVENDLDWSDNKVAVNVGYGVLSYTFANLETNASYIFTIYPYTNTGVNIDYKTDGTAPEANATTANLTSINNESFDASLGTWTQYNVFGDQTWEWAATYGNPPGCAKISGYDGAPFENEDWLISPALDLSDFTNITFGFEHARNYATNDGLFIYISTNYDGVGDPSVTGDWTDITSSFIFPEGGWDFVDAGSFDISAFTSTGTYLAFVFNSNTTESATWEVDNIKVLGVMSTGIQNNNISKLSVYPNPASNVVNIISKQQGNMNIYTTTGKVVISSSIASGVNAIDIESLNNGMYIIETITTDGSKSVSKLTVR